MDGSVLLLILVVVAIVFVAFYVNGRKSSGQASPRERRGRGDEARTRDASRAADATRIAQDMRGMKTSRVADAVEILDDLGRITPGYRQYCELVGTSMRDGGVVAPYSKQEVAYYDVRCYRIERRDGRDVETLVAREKSVRPLWFTDDSSDERVRVDVASFGDDMTLVTAMDHVEGPDSDFAHAFAGAPAVSTRRDEDAGRDAGREASPASGRAGFATGMPGGLQDFLAGVDPRVLEDMRDFARRGGRGSDLAEIGGALLGAGIGALVNSLGSPSTTRRSSPPPTTRRSGPRSTRASCAATASWRTSCRSAARSSASASSTAWAASCAWAARSRPRTPRRTSRRSLRPRSSRTCSAPAALAHDTLPRTAP